MLTVRHVLACYDECVAVTLTRSCCRNSLCYQGAQKGNYESGDILIYLPHAESVEDLGITVLHEFIHARDDVIEKFTKARKGLEHHLEERLVEEEAVRTYNKSFHVLRFIDDLYGLRLASRILLPVIPKIYLPREKDTG